MTTDPSSDVLERVALAIERADNENGYDYDHLGIDHPQISDWGIHLALAAIAAMPTIERLSAELAELKLDNAELERVCKVQVEVVAELEERVERLSAERMQLREALLYRVKCEAYCDRQRACEDGGQCHCQAEFDHAVNRAALSNTAENGWQHVLEDGSFDHEWVTEGGVTFCAQCEVEQDYDK